MLETENYCITPQNILAHELIGLDVIVKDSTDESRIGLKGKVVDETKNVLKIEEQKRRPMACPGRLFF